MAIKNDKGSSVYSYLGTCIDQEVKMNQVIG